MHVSKLKLDGSVVVKLNGKVVVEDYNLVVTVGAEWVADRIVGGGTQMTHLGVGTGTTSPVIGDTTLEAEADREPLTTAGGVASSATVQFTATFQSGPGSLAAAITEAGIFNNSSGGDMLSRINFSEINKTVDDVLTVTWTITIAGV